jgi:hypothetical protein
MRYSGAWSALPPASDTPSASYIASGVASDLQYYNSDNDASFQTPDDAVPAGRD